MQKELLDKGNMLVIAYSFNSLYEYVNYLENGETSAHFVNNESSFSTSHNAWCGTNSFEEAVQLCLEGEYDEKFDDFDRERMKLERNLAEKRRRAKIKKDIVGFAPNVPAFLKGIPENMYNVDKRKRKAPKVIDVYYQISALSFVTPQQMRNRGICTLTLIKELEREGYSVNLHLFEMSDCGRQRVFTQWNLKKPGQPMDYRSLYFPMVNPSFLRRLSFRLREITPELTSTWVNGYGSTCGLGTVKSYLQTSPTAIVVNQPDDHGINGRDIEEDYKQFVRSVSRDLDKAKKFFDEKERTQADDGGR